jgi:ABC-type lipoprotein release transport system permease subunit
MLNQENSFLFKFAWKSILRNSGRSFFIGFSVSLAVLIAVWVIAFFDGMNHQIEKAVVNTNTGYFQIQDQEYSRTTDAAKPVAYTRAPREILDSPEVKAHSPELVLDGNISTPEGSAGLVALGIVPELHSQFLPIYRKIFSGEYLTEQDESLVIIGKELADIFHYQVGDQLVLNYQDYLGELRSELLTIKGIYHYNSKSFEKRVVYLNQRTWQQLFFNQYRDEILFNRINLMTKDLSPAQEFKNKITQAGLVLKSWKNLNPEMAVVLDFHDGMTRFFFVIIGITIIMTILTPVQMLWQERLKELRLLNIIGVSNNKFWKIGLFEVFQMIISSGIFSSLLLIFVIGIQSKTGVDFRFLNQEGLAIERAGIKLPGIIYPLLTVNQILVTFVFVIIVLGISYFWSIHNTLKKLKVSA